MLIIMIVNDKGILKVHLYVYFACLGVCLSVCLFVCFHPINVKMAESIRPTFFFVDNAPIRIEKFVNI